MCMLIESDLRLAQACFYANAFKSNQLPLAGRRVWGLEFGRGGRGIIE